MSTVSQPGSTRLSSSFSSPISSCWDWAKWLYSLWYLSTASCRRCSGDLWASETFFSA